MAKVGILNYGCGNITSVKSSLAILGYDSKIISSEKEITKIDSLIIPGVGNYSYAMSSIKELSFDSAIKEHALIKKRKILGICLGFQIMSEAGTEGGETQGLGIINSKVEKFNCNYGNSPITHIGFNSVIHNTACSINKNLGELADYYFLHSYRYNSEAIQNQSSFCDYCEKFPAIYENENVFGVQFHPEKSQTNGLRLLNNFLGL